MPKMRTPSITAYHGNSRLHESRQTMPLKITLVGGDGVVTRFDAAFTITP